MPAWGLVWLLLPAVAGVRVSLYSTSGQPWTRRGVFLSGNRLPISGPLSLPANDCSLNFPDSPLSIVLILTSSNCSIELEIRRAIHSNASALLIPAGRILRTPLKWNTEDSNVAVIVIPQLSEDSEILNQVVTNNTVHALISVEDELPVIYSYQFKKYVFISTTIICLIMFIGGCFGMFCYKTINNEVNHRNSLKVPEEALIDETISKIPSRILQGTDEKVIEESDTCAVCFECYRSFEEITLLPCSHVFHRNCIDPWLSERRLCPLCKMDVLKYYGLPPSRSEESIINISLDDNTSIGSD